MSSTEEFEDKPIILDVEPDELDTVASYISDADTICSICLAEFLDPDDLKIHIEQVHNARSLHTLSKCQFCTEEFFDDMEYAEHIRDIHITSLKCCKYCWRVFDQEDAYRIHVKKHLKSRSSDTTYNCSQCPLRYTELLLLKKHEYENHGNEKACEGITLRAIFPYLSAALKVKSTMFLESLGTDVPYVCSGCSYSSSDLNTYLKHVRCIECDVFVCYKCSSVFNMKRNIAKHMKSKCNIFGIKNKKTRLCTDCNTNIAITIYARHKTQCKPIKCYVCDLVFQNMNDWSEHQSKQHTGTSVSVETCQYCWKRCVGSVAMKKHIDKIHRPEFHLYKYMCVYCNSVFKHPQKLFAHFVTQHKDLNPYTCKICDKSFRFRKKFTIHIKLSHKSEGFVEFDENYHVFFTNKKSKNPFIPKSIYVDETETGKAIIKNTDENKYDTDFINATEPDGNQTENDVEEKKKLKRKRIGKKGSNKSVSLESSDDSEPLLTLRKRVRLQKKVSPNNELKKRQSNKTLLTCKICNKYCYTQQNYQHHISLHSKHEVKKCIKCAKIFKSKTKLNEHVAKEHSTSKLTETLKILLEKRKTGGSLSDDLPMSEKFRRTIKKVSSSVINSSATITPVNQKLSVQKFLENFVPEDNNKATIPITTTATIKFVDGVCKEPVIKMTKFIPSPMNNSLKLAMPVKFVDHYPEKVNVSIKLVDPPISSVDADNFYSEHSNDIPDLDRNESIPEVAEEVMLENSDGDHNNINKDTAHKIVIPKLKIEMKDVKIAHLLPEAPYYKIVKVKDVLDLPGEEKQVDTSIQSSIKLPDGTKLVTTNPLAHLLGNNTDKIMESFKSNYYKSKNKNFQGMLANALKMLDKPTPRKKKTPKKE